MCGIAGALLSASRSLQANDVVGRMVRALGHRGPDGSGVVRCGPERPAGDVDAALGHTRLAILDLSDRARQPMTDAAGRYWITFNGEIFNCVDLRRELEACGHQFRSRSDTEVILEGYLEWGERVVDRLRGMFAFAIWDAEQSQLFVARDRLGIKPFYYLEREGQFLFASEVQALLASTLVERTVDPVALDQYLAYQTAATPRTLVSGVRMLEPGRLIRWRPGSPSVAWTYWDLINEANSSARDATDAEAAERMTALVDESVRLHLASDVPVGIFLSGGVDSSALALLVRRAGVTPRTFGVSFPGTAFDEGPYARQVAEAIGAAHTEIAVDETALLRDLPDAVSSFDHPSGDGVNTYVVSKAVRSAGTKVALSGLGGDELFGGYASFSRLSRARHWSRAWQRTPAAVRTAAATAVRRLGPSSVAFEKTAAILETDGSLWQTYPVLRQVFSNAQRQQLLGPAVAAAVARKGDAYVALLEAALSGATALSFSSQVTYAEARTYMHDVLLRDTDQMSMRHGLEVRVPLLDHVLVEYAMGLSDAAKRGPAGPKHLLLSGIRHELPAVCLSRPKQGFVFPFATWMRGQLRPFCEAHLLGGSLEQRAGLDGTAVRRLWTAFLEGKPSVSWSRLWTLVALGAWLDRHGVSR